MNEKGGREAEAEDGARGAEKNGEERGGQKPEMRVDPARAKSLLANLENVTKRVDGVRAGREVRLIAVSKLKPASDVLALHEATAGRQRDFGENYAGELMEKAGALPRAIRWHMIGALQSNKCKPLAEQVPNLFCVGSVDSAKKADALEKGRRAARAAEEPLRVMVQVNTSGEESKSGVDPADAVALCRHVHEACPNLRLAGLMTIGAIARSREAAAGGADTVNDDFVALRETRDRVARELGVAPAELELSMGMSADFEAAIVQGSDEVRVGTTIFGERPAKKDATVF